MDLENLRRLLTAEDANVRRQGVMLGADLWPDLDWSWRVLVLLIGCRLGVLGPRSLSDEDRCQVWHYLRRFPAGAAMLPDVARFSGRRHTPIGGASLFSIPVGVFLPPDESGWQRLSSVDFQGTDAHGLRVMSYDYGD